MMLKLLIATCLVAAASAATSGTCDLSPIMTCHNNQATPPDFNAGREDNNWNPPPRTHECCTAVRTVRGSADCDVAGVFNAMRAPIGMDPVDYYSIMMGWLSHCEHSPEPICAASAEALFGCVFDIYSGSTATCCDQAMEFHNNCIGFDVRLEGVNNHGSDDGNDDNDDTKLFVAHTGLAAIMNDHSADHSILQRYLDEDRDEDSNGGAEWVCPEPYGPGSCGAVYASAAHCNQFLLDYASQDPVVGEKSICCLVADVIGGLCAPSSNWNAIAAAAGVSDQAIELTNDNIHTCRDRNDYEQCHDLIHGVYHMGGMLVRHCHPGEETVAGAVVANYRGQYLCHAGPMPNIVVKPHCSEAYQNHHHHYDGSGDSSMQH